MSDQLRRMLSEKEATWLWQRAAELQAKSARRLEEQTRESVRAHDRSAVTEEEGYDLGVVRAAAQEVGIRGEFLERALIEREVEAVTGVEPDRRSTSVAGRFLDESRDYLEVHRTIPASSTVVLEVMQHILPIPPFSLRLTDTVGPRPLEGGVLVFHVPSPYSEYSSMGGTFRSAVAWSDLKHVLVSVRDLARDGPLTEVTVRSPIARAKSVNLWVGVGFTSVVAGLGGLIGAGLAGAAAWTAGLVGMPAAAVIGLGALGTGGAGAWGFRGAYRALFRHGMRRGEAGLNELLRSLDANVRSGSGFSLPPQRDTGDG